MSIKVKSKDTEEYPIYIKIKDTVELKQCGDGENWTLGYYNLKGEYKLLATFTSGPLQSVIMIDSVRRVQGMYLLEKFDIVCSDEALATLQQRVPDLKKVG